MNHDQKFARSVKIPLGDGNSIEGDLTIPADAKAIVIFAHGSGGNRYSTRNNYVSEVLNEYRLATLLDLIILNRFSEENDDMR